MLTFSCGACPWIDVTDRLIDKANQFGLSRVVLPFTIAPWRDCILRQTS